MTSLATLQQRYNAACQKMAPTGGIYRFQTTAAHDGSPHVELDNGRYHYLVTERGLERTRQTTADPDELLYWMVGDAAFGMAVSYELAHRIPGQDVRRVLFARELALLRRVDAAWTARKQAEIEAILRAHPFVDARQTFRAHAVWRGLALFGLLFFAAGLAITLITTARDETSALFVLLFGLLTAAFAAAWWAWSTAVHLDSDTLTIQRPLGATTIPYLTITGVSANQLLTIRTTSATHRLWFPALDFLAQLARALDDRARPWHSADPLPDLPVTFRNRSYFPLVMLPLGLLMLAISAGLGWELATSGVDTAVSDSLLIACMLPLMLAVGAWLVYTSLVRFPWRITFAPDAIRVRYTLRTQRFDPAAITAITLRSETRTYRGFSRDVAFIDIQFGAAKPLRVESGMGAYPTDYSAAAEAAELQWLTAVLQAHYRPDGHNS